MDMMDCVLSLSEVDLDSKECGNPRSTSLEERTQSIISIA
jgi:hypothetical protein